MARSTGIVLAAGALSMTDLVVTGYDASQAVRILGATVAAAVVSAGLDAVLPGFGTGAAVLLLLACIYRYLPHLANNVLPAHTSSAGAEARVSAQ